MKKINAAINGFGRIGKLLLRIASDSDNIEIVAINDPFVSIENALYIIKYDTIHGKFDKNAYIDGDYIVIEGKKILYTSHLKIENIDWKSCGVNVVFESSGAFTSKAGSQKHIKSGAEKVIITGPSKDSPMFVMGVNENEYKQDMDIISNSSCTTNCLAPIAKILNDKYGIEEGLMTTIHAQTASQAVVDTANKKNMRLGRSGSQNIIPSSTGAAKAVGVVIPELKGKITGMSLRVPTINVSVVDFTVKLKRGTNYDDIVKTIKKSSIENENIVGYEEDGLVSSDFIGDERSCIIDINASIMLSDKFLKILAWYDNEWAYSKRVIELAEYIYKKSN